MTTALRRLAAVAALAVTATGLTACAGSPWDTAPCRQDAQIHVGFVLAQRANEPALRILPEVDELLETAIRSNGDYVTVVPDGKPFVYDYNYLGSEQTDGSNCTREHDDQIESFGDYLLETPAMTDEVDVLQALHLAANGIVDKDGDKVLIVIDNGLQTVEPLDLAGTDRLYAYTATEIVDDLESRGLLPTKLAGMTVYWSGMGGAVAPQEPLTIEAENRLKSLWRELIERSGATLELLSEALPPQAAQGVTTAVTPVEIREVVGLPEPLQISEDSVKFLPDRADYAFPETARTYLRGVAELIQGDPSSGVVTVTGVTDDYGTVEHQIDIAERRADAVIATLVEFGVPAERLVGQGLGSQWACFDPDDSDANRKVVITTSLQRPEDVCR